MWKYNVSFRYLIAMIKKQNILRYILVDSLSTQYNFPLTKRQILEINRN